MLFRRGRFSAAAVLAFLGALSSVTTPVAHGIAHEHAADRGIVHAVPQEQGTVTELRAIETGHAPDHAILHEAGSATRPAGVSIDISAEEHDRAPSALKSRLDPDRPRFELVDRPPAREFLRADSPRAPPA